MTDLETKSSELNSAVFKNFIGYIPKTLINLLNDEPLKACEALDNLIYLDDKLRFIQYQSEHALAIIAKVELSSNCFKLVEHRRVLDEFSFSYLVKRYFELLKIAMSYSHHFMNVLDELTSEKHLQIKYLIPIQNQSFYLHIIEVEKITGIRAEDIRRDIRSLAIQQRHLYSVPLNLIGNLDSTELAKPRLILGNETIFKAERKALEGLSPNNSDNNFQKENSLNRVNKKIKNAPSVTPLKELICHPKNEEIANIIVKSFSDYSGIQLRFLIEYFIEKGVISIAQGSKAKFYNSYKELSTNENFARYSTVFENRKFHINSENYKQAKSIFDNFFKDLLKKTN